MFVWRGWGIVVVLITFLCSLVAELTTRGLAGRGYWETAQLSVGDGTAWRGRSDLVG